MNKKNYKINICCNNYKILSSLSKIETMSREDDRYKPNELLPEKFIGSPI